MAGQSRRHRRRESTQTTHSFRSLVIVTVGFLFLIGGLVVLSVFNATSVDVLTVSSPQDIPNSVLKQLDAILVLGGGVPASVSHPPTYVERRCDDAATVVRKLNAMSSETIPILCLSAGTAHLPQLLSKDGLPVWESTACAAYLAQNHGLSKNVYVETTSYDTIGNAFYARTSHTDLNGWRNLLIITNEFHMERTKTIFDWIFNCDKTNYKLYYLTSPNVGLGEDAVKARREREAQSEQTIREKLAPKYRTLKDVWRFLNHDHALYTSWKLVDRANGSGDATASEIVKRSYGSQSNL